ncbi:MULTISPECIES: exonuclease SbcCD subunit D [unclassified Kaistella]|uniref:metallophosphoesterase family protein n=1 Tax=unclassified Kaistella TaxID=2762626 RepID=UPI0027339BEB|nr:MULTISPECIES: exonuclease SbcCD subunit D [unclassified Kaistella]MDP2453452.1 exonuclease SbcCD subunit D [Kaistella sp. SH11-4b]MDP2456509.1 exonuclease SbcCD subunit D [Kaistella sp. SH40-3]MDP2459265.1 exonuclease SbcCD subunit D [Kaistella sp. SH19-2b]
MKILHTADWHLGKRLDRFSRLEEQILVMDEIVQIADEQNVDMVLVAGDLFDNFNPSVEAIELFYKTLKRLSQNGKRPVIAISGNHDSPYLIDAPDPLARECGIILIGHPKAKVTPFEVQGFKISNSVEGMIEIELKSYDFPIRIVHTAFANEIRLKEYFGENKEDALNKVLAENWATIADEFCDKNGVNILMTHLYMNKRGAPVLEEPDGEKPIKIGNADLIYSDTIPSQIQYTALGHLHAFRNIGTEEKPVVYSSSPLCYSFSEAGQTKYVAIIEAKPNQNVSYEKIALKNGKSLVRKTFDEVEKAIEWLSENQNTFVELTLESETYLKAEERKMINNAHHGIVHLIPKVKNQEFNQKQLHDINLNQDIQSLFKDYFKSKNNAQEPNEDLLNLFNEILNA